MPPAAKLHYDRGLNLFRARDFAGAVRAFEEGFAVEPRREFLFAEAQALRLAGDCARAVPLYQRFIDSGPQPVQAQAARLGIDRCAPERSQPSPAAGESGAKASAAPPADEPRLWWRDPWALTSTGLGVVALGIGAAAWLSSDRYVDQAQSARTTTLDSYDRLWDLATNRRRLAIAGLAGGAGLIAAGAARALWVYRHQRAADTAGRLSFWPGTDGGGTLMWEGRF